MEYITSGVEDPGGVGLGHKNFNSKGGLGKSRFFVKKTAVPG